MGDLRFTLISDGGSDRSLVHVLRWLLISNGVARPIHPDWADLAQIRKPPNRLRDKIRVTLQLYPCHLLFVHRDAETRGLTERKAEIVRAVHQASSDIGHVPPAVCVVPVRMSEAWFLFDKAAIRHAAGNPGGRMPLDLPRIDRIESMPDPKSYLHELIAKASGLTGRRRRKLHVDVALHQLASVIEDYSPLRDLPAFAVLEDDLHTVITSNGWNVPE